LFQARSRETVLRSAWIEAIEPVPDGIEIRGRGYGHGVGLCQVGAIRRARAGEGAEQILLHYYPGAEIVPLPPES
jgi:stage II sporulation protein D